MPSTFDLPPHLDERTHALNESGPDAGDRVIYWMRTAVRGHENPALDVAISMANRLGKPLFVYHALSERYPYASDRIHRFILEGARDVAIELEMRGIQHCFHLERPGHRGTHLKTLARTAAVIITEDMPVEPLRGWAQALAAAADCPVLAVDTACVLPMRMAKKAPSRAYQFRKQTQEARTARLEGAWPEVELTSPSAPPERLPFEPIDLSSADLADLIAACGIDHGIAPVPHTVGGSLAGYARWSDFRDTRLKAYGRRRNDALQPDAVSRLSAYLHFGQVSPFRIAREAFERRAEKFLDQLLIWREMSYAWCCRTESQEDLTALPDWARATLTSHAGDPRPELFSWETLARAQTRNPLWDAAQRSLMIHGELHNNVRMTWGKALLNWTKDPARALAMLIDLNHRYALDGRDPNSYGGLLWCLGLFDRPFEPEKPIFGSVRPRSTQSHARRLDPEAYGEITGRPALAKAPTVAVIGAGIAGLACARTLSDHGLAVTVFDKSRGLGGRLATRRAEPFAFDHGAQYFTARDPRFQRYVESWLEDDILSSWSPAGDDKRGFVATSAMNGLGKHLGRDLNCRLGQRIDGLEEGAGGWTLVADDSRSLGSFYRVVVATPAPQASPLLDAFPELTATLAKASYAPCWALMLGFDRALDVSAPTLRPETGTIAWAARNNTKAGRPEAEAWVIHARPDWSAHHLELEAGEVEQVLLTAAAELFADTWRQPVHVQAHRWRYALVTEAVGEACLWDGKRGLGACGDWCLGPRIELAWLSGMAMAGRVLGA